jgi:DNA polymerase-3 subunit gamma/tau
MAYTVLARKYRSQTFDDIVGQEVIAQTLKNAIKTGRVAHAYLFTGTRGVGKTTAARILAKALNCLSFKEPTTEPCCKCESCIAVNAGEDIDVIEIDGASNRGIEHIRELRQNAIYTPARARYKIYIIDEVHMLTTESFNALLKILEEPPSHVKFIFATTEPNKVLATIQSRCQRFDFGTISAPAIAGQLRKILEQEKIKYEDDLLLPLAGMANGSMRDALSLLDRLISTGTQPLTSAMLEEFLGKADTEKIAGLVAAIGASNGNDTLTAIQALIGAGMSEPRIVDALVDYMRDMMVAKISGPDSEMLVLTEQQRKRIAEIAAGFDIAALVYNITALEKLRWTIKNSDNPRPLLEASLLRFALSEHFLNIDDLLSRAGGVSPADVKKKPVPADPPMTQDCAAGAFPAASSPQIQRLEMADLDSIKSQWAAFLDAVAGKIGAGTKTLLNSAVPAAFEDSVLTLTFPVSQKVTKQMCESNGRIEQIESALLDCSGKPIKLKLVLENEQSPQQNTAAPVEQLNMQERKNQMLNDPAVKMVLTELSATVTGIEHDRPD